LQYNPTINRQAQTIVILKMSRSVRWYPTTIMASRRHELGQFFTPGPIADYMASLFEARWSHLELLDAGAGDGALTAALVRRLGSHANTPRSIAVTAYEIDPALVDPLRATFSRCQQACETAGIAFSATVFNEDFIAAAAPMVSGGLFSPQPSPFNAAIINPPYRKIRSESMTRLLLRSAGIETSNLYTGFVALVVKLLTDGSELVAITPRSFCNGPYFKPFRVDFLKAMSLRRVHVFDSRSAAFRRDDVLQENIIVHAVKGGTQQEQIIISSSSGEPNGPVRTREVAYQDVVSPDDPEKFIHLTVNDNHSTAHTAMNGLHSTLGQLGLTVSTGRVVDFRVKDFLRQRPDGDTAPLIYPCHFEGGFIRWPRNDSRKPNAIVNDERTRDLLVPAGAYVLVKRFTAKEERRRVVAAVYDPTRLRNPLIGFENHLNYFHFGGRGLTMPLAKGLAAFLNSTIVDDYFRRFSGHTQVNATDLRMLSYPDSADLTRLGQKVDSPQMPQEELDTLVQRELF